MNFQFNLTENTPNYEIKMFGNANGGAFGSEWSEKKWYDGILIIHHKLTKKDDIFFFKTYGIRDEELFPFTIEHILNTPTNYLSEGSIREKTIDNFCSKVLESSTQKENLPFRFIEIDRCFT